MKKSFRLRGTTETFQATIFIAGDFKKIKKKCQEYCDRIGLCVTVEPTEYIYTKGAEKGARIGLINYPRFPQRFNSAIFCKAESLLYYLMKDSDQISATIMTSDKTYYYATKEKK
jgi:hypothetical protein